MKLHRGRQGKSGKDEQRGRRGKVGDKGVRGEWHEGYVEAEEQRREGSGARRRT